MKPKTGPKCTPNSANTISNNINKIQHPVRPYDTHFCKKKFIDAGKLSY